MNSSANNDTRESCLQNQPERLALSGAIGRETAAVQIGPRCSTFATAVRDSAWVFAITEVVHLWGLAILLRAVMMLFSLSRDHLPFHDLSQNEARRRIITVQSVLWESYGNSCYDALAWRRHCSSMDRLLLSL